MDKKNVSFVYKNIVVGGVQTLLLRLSKALIESGNKVSIYYNTIYANGTEVYTRYGIDLYKYEGDIPKSFNDDFGTQLIITFEPEIYIKLVINNYKNRKNKDRIFLYSVHPYTFEYFYNGCKYKIIKKIFHKTYYSFVKKSVEAGFVFFMDEQCLNSTSKEFLLKNDNNYVNDCILRIIMPTNGNYSCRNKEKTGIDILTVSRADFPFKGYIKGLVQVVSSIKSEGYDVRLKIITAGNEINKVRDWCNDISNIEILDNIKYEELPNYYRESDIYVGMGTTILEAAAEGIIAIPVSPYTYECNSHGLFCDKPNWILTEIGEGKSINELIKQIVTLNKEEKNNLQMKMINSVYNLYSIENVLKQLNKLLSYKIDVRKQYKILPFGYIYFLKTKKIIRKFIKRRSVNGK